jgi:hypothetical protein
MTREKKKHQDKTKHIDMQKETLHPDRPQRGAPQIPKISRTRQSSPRHPFNKT